MTNNERINLLIIVDGQKIITMTENKTSTVRGLKKKLAKITEYDVEFIQVKIYDINNTERGRLDKDNVTLEDAGLREGYRLHVSQKSARVVRSGSSDLSAEILRREESVKEYLKKKMLGIYSEKYLEKRRKSETSSQSSSPEEEMRH